MSLRSFGLRVRHNSNEHEHSLTAQFPADKIFLPTRFQNEMDRGCARIVAWRLRQLGRCRELCLVPIELPGLSLLLKPASPLCAAACAHSVLHIEKVIERLCTWNQRRSTTSSTFRAAGSARTIGRNPPHQRMEPREMVAATRASGIDHGGDIDMLDAVAFDPVHDSVESGVIDLSA